MDMTGYSFDPASGNRARQAFNGGSLPPNANEALRVLSMRLPTILGGRPIAPDGLLRPGLPGADPVHGGPVGSAPAAPPPQPPRASGGPVGSQPLGSVNMSGGQSPLGPLADGAMSPSGPPGSPTIGFGGGTQPAPNPVNANPAYAPLGPSTGGGGGGGGLAALLNTLFSGQDFGGRGGFGGAGGGRAF